MATIENSSCPSCHAKPGCLTLENKLVAYPSLLSGSSLKVSARERPVLTCADCAEAWVGDYDADGRHVTFTDKF